MYKVGRIYYIYFNQTTSLSQKGVLNSRMIVGFYVVCLIR